MEKAKIFVNKNKSKILPVIVFITSLLVALFLYFIYVEPILDEPMISENSSGNLFAGAAPLKEESMVVQNIFREDLFSGVSVLVGTHSNTYSDITVEMSLRDNASNEYLFFMQQTIETVYDNSYINIVLSEPVYLENGNGTLYLIISGFAEQGDLSLWISETGDVCIIDGEVINGSITMNFIETSKFVKPYFWFIALAISILLALLSWLIFFRKAAVCNIFLVVSMGFGILYMFAYPPYGHNDDSVHIPLTFYYSSRLMGGEELEYYFFENRKEDSMLGFSAHYPRREHYGHIYKHFFEKEKEEGATYSQTTYKIGKPYQYYPQIFGVTIARLLKFGQVPTLYMGFLFSLIAYTALMYVALRIVPFKTFFAIMGTAPYAIYSAGSFSYDTSIYALCFFFIAYVLYIRFDKSKMQIWDYAILALTGMLIFPLKYIYSAVLLIVFIIPKEKWFSKWAKPVLAGLIGLAAIIIIINFPKMGFLEWDAGLVGETPWADPEGSYTYNWMFHNPQLFIRLILSTVIDRAEELIISVGAMQYSKLSVFYGMIWYILAFLSISPAQGESVLQVKKSDRIIFMALGITVYILAIFAAFQWTYIGSYYVVGAQGRYYMAILPLLILPFYNCVKRRKNNDNKLLYAVVLLNAYSIIFHFMGGIYNRLPDRIFHSSGICV